MHTSWEKLTKYLLEQKHSVYVAEDNKTYGIQYTFPISIKVSEIIQ
jgi:hypothetical protein